MCAFTFVNRTTEQNKSLVVHAKRPIITIWLPGTKLTPNFAFKSFFHRIPGLRKATDYEPDYHKRKMAEMLCKKWPKQYKLDHFYYFGWSGQLCFSQRKKAAKDLIKELQKLVKKHKNIIGQPPFLRIIAHSHGGNVALNLAKLQSKKAPITIDELVLLACPVQDKTRHLVKQSCFKKVYAFYSASDIFQVIDPQGWYKKGKASKLFSDRTFDHCDTLRQARIKMNGREIMHVDFLLTKFLEQLPRLCHTLDEYYKTIAPSQIHYNKQLDIRCKSDPVVINKKLI